LHHILVFLNGCILAFFILKASLWPEKRRFLEGFFSPGFAGFSSSANSKENIIGQMADKSIFHLQKNAYLCKLNVS